MASASARRPASVESSIPRASVTDGANGANLTLGTSGAGEGGAANWPDAWLLAAVRREPPDVSALDALVSRYWKPLFARCEVLTLNRDRANDLAQESWVRVLRARHHLDPEGNFGGYLTTVATNIWRDWQRAIRRAGNMGDHRLASLDDEVCTAGGDRLTLVDVIPDLGTLPPEEHALLKLDLDRALARLEPRQRDVLIARYIDGESAAEIGARYGRTEQTITAWLRQAIREIRQYLGDSPLWGSREDSMP